MHKVNEFSRRFIRS